ncbi:MAG: flagellar biosynthesis protein FlhB [Hyphomicrobium sp.]|nr:MAG: flagellar biosynthesis protein FlhB [Hyphomicrobium sp.]
MSEEKDKESKSELPTEKKQQDALEKGNAPISREVAHFVFFSTLIIVLGFSPGLFAAMSGVLQSFIERPHEFRLANASDVALLIQVLSVAMAPMLAAATLAFLVTGIAATGLQSPPRIAIDRIKPQMSRLSLKSGWKRITGAHGIAELLKGIVKLGVVGAIGAAFVLTEGSPIIASMDVPLEGIAQLSLKAVTSVMWYVAGAAAAIAIADVLWTRQHWTTELKMTKQEVRDEHKQQEGDPALDSRRRATARARSRKRMMANVGKATLVVANPTHYAVAMRYVRTEGGAPMVVAKGTDLIALQIRRLAEESGIPVVENKALARTLFNAVEVDQAIPAAFYRAIAEILIMLQRRSNPMTAKTLRA